MTQPTDASRLTETGLDALSGSLQALAQQALELRTDISKRDEDALKQRRADRRLLKAVLGFGAFLTLAVIALVIIVLVQAQASAGRGASIKSNISDSETRMESNLVRALLCYDTYPPKLDRDAFVKCISSTRQN